MGRTFFHTFVVCSAPCIALLLSAPAPTFAANARVYLSVSASASLAQSPRGISAGDLVALTNGDRTEHRLAPLRVDPRLTLAAQNKAMDMAVKGYFAHVSPEGRDPWYWFSVAGYDFIFAGENLAVDFLDSAAVEAAWMNSSGHRANILNSAYTEIGIATVQGIFEGHTTTFVVEEFGTPRKLHGM